MIKIKKITFLGIIIAFLGSIFLLVITTYNKSSKDTVNKIAYPDKKDKEEIVDKYISLDMNPKSISIIKTGNPVRKKVITSSEDMEKIRNFIESIHLEKKLNESYKGWGYNINITDTNNKKHSVSFSSFYVAYDDSQYTIDSSVTEKFNAIYNTLNYPEVDPLK